mgnify:CR=1 FL=1
MDSAELSRKVAEAMGCRVWDCDLDGDIYCGVHLPIGGDAKFVIEDGHCKYGVPFNLADARDREAVIEWLNAQGMKVVLEYDHTGAHVWLDDCIHRQASTIEEAFGRAFLAAMGAGE